MSCGVGRRYGMDPTLLWLWCRLVVTALIQPLAWEPPYAMEQPKKLQKDKKKKEEINQRCHKQMARYTMLLDWKNQYYQNDYTTQGNLQIQSNYY